MIGNIKINIKIILLTFIILFSIVPIGIQMEVRHVSISEKTVFANDEDPPAAATNSTDASGTDDVVPDDDTVIEDYGGLGTWIRDKALRPFVWLALLIPTLIKQLAALLLWISGTFLNFSIFFGIIKMGDIIGSAAAIKNAWAIMRDLVNLFFIFGLLYLSVMTIIGGWSDNIKKRLSLLIIAGLLINFSFFFTSIFIDISNIVTLSIYEKMDQCQFPSQTRGANPRQLPDISQVGSEIPDLELLTDGGLSFCLADKLGVSGTFKRLTTPDGDALVRAMDEKNLGIIQKIITLLFAALIFILVSVVFFGISITIFSRFILIIFLLITSPIMFAGWVLPKLEEHTSTWTKKLGEQLIFLPAMFLMLYIGYELSGSVLSGGTNIGIRNSEHFANIFSEFGLNLIGSLINIAITLGFIVGALIIGKKLGAIGMEVASLMGFAASAAIGAGAFVGSGVFGSMGAGLSKLGSREGAGRITRNLGRAGEWVSRRSFDLRQLPGTQTALKNIGIDAGKPSKAAAGGFRGRGEAMGETLAKNQEVYDKFRPANERVNEENVAQRTNNITEKRRDVQEKKNEVKLVDSNITAAEESLKRKQDEAAKLDRDLENLNKKKPTEHVRSQINAAKAQKNKIEIEISTQQNIISTENKKKQDAEDGVSKLVKKYKKEDMEKAVGSFGGVYRSKNAVKARVKKMNKSEIDKLREEMVKEMKKDNAAGGNQ